MSRPSKKLIVRLAFVISVCTTILTHIRLSFGSSGSDSRELVNGAISTTSTASTSSCPSLFRQLNKDNEHSPLVFHEHNLVVCRTPKVASLELRGIARAHYENTTFVPLTLNRPYTGNHTLADVSNEYEFHHYLYGDNVTRIMFVRHPIYRLLSGFLEVARFPVFWTKIHQSPTKLRGTSPKAFQKWIVSGMFRQHYHSSCNDESTNKSLNRAVQHWAPPQHCRCGIHDCNVEWQVYKMEEEEEEETSIGSVLSNYLPQRHLPPQTQNGEDQARLHKRSYNVRDYLAPDILDILNEATRKEQEFFGYEPLTVEDLR